MREQGAWLFKQLQILLSVFALHSCMHIRNEIPVKPSHFISFPWQHCGLLWRDFSFLTLLFTFS